MTGGNVRMGSWVEVGVDAEAHRRLTRDPARNFAYAMEFRARLDVDHEDFRLERGFDLLIGLAYAGKDDLPRIAARPQTAHQLANGYDIEASPHIDVEFEHAQVRQ